MTTPNRLYPDNWLQTYTGRRFWPLEPRAEDVSITDVAHALSMLCRYGGHSKHFYSVAEHCVLVSEQVGLHGLLHDAAEAYLLDIPRPVKQLLPQYSDAEDRVLEVIYDSLALRLPSEEEERAVKEADNRTLATEKLVLHRPGPQWASLPEPYSGVVIACWTPSEAEVRWLAAFRRLAP